MSETGITGKGASCMAGRKETGELICFLLGIIQAEAETSELTPFRP